LQLQGSPWFHLFLADYPLDLLFVSSSLFVFFLRLGPLWFLFGSPWASLCVFFLRFSSLEFVLGSGLGSLGFCLCLVPFVFGFVLGSSLAPFLVSPFLFVCSLWVPLWPLLSSCCSFFARCFCCWFHAKSFFKSSLDAIRLLTFA